MKPEDVIRKASKAIDKAFDQVTTPKETRALGGKIKNQIVKRSLLGYGVDRSTRARVKFPPLSASYIAQRKGQLRFYTNKKTGQVFAVQLKGRSRVIRAKKGASGSGPKKASKGKVSKRKKINNRASNLSKKTTPSKSNITATGLLLRSIRFTGENRRVIISVKNVAYKKNIFGEDLSKRVTTTQVVGYLKDMKRVFLLLTKAEKRKIEREGGKKIREIAAELIRTNRV